jgi:hypothetical protein
MAFIGGGSGAALAFVLLFCLLPWTAAGCKQRVPIESSDFRAAQADSPPICENLSAWRQAGPIDESALRRELGPIDYREDFESFQDVINKAQRIKAQEPLAHTLDVLEIASILAYTNTAYADINKALWERRCEDYVNAARALASGIIKAPGVRGALYRGGQISTSELVSNIYRPGSLIEAPAFLSFSLDRSTAERFVRNAFFEVDPGVGGYTRVFSSWVNEKEVTFVPGTTFRVDSVEEMRSREGEAQPPLHVKMTQVSQVPQELIHDYQPVEIRPGLINSAGSASGPMLHGFLRGLFRDQIFSGRVLSTTTGCRVETKVLADDSVSVSLFGGQPSAPIGTIMLRPDGFLTTGNTNWQIGKVATHFESRLPAYPMLVYHLASNERAAGHSMVTLSFGFRGADLSLNHFAFTSPEVPYTPGCTF